MNPEKAIEQKRAFAMIRIEERRAAAAVQAAHAEKVKAMRKIGAFQCLLIAADMPLVRVGGNCLHDLREDVFDAMSNANGRAGVYSIAGVYDSAMMGGEPFAVWN